MNEPHKAAGPRKLTERRVAEELGIDRLEVYLVAADQKVGRYDALTHLLVFSDAEVETMAAWLGVARRKLPELSEAELKRIPEPTGE